jgi:hypothetical protein
MGFGTAGGLDHLVHDVPGRGAVGIAHAEIDDVFATAPGGGFEFAGDVEDISGEAANAREFVHGNLVVADSMRRAERSVG